MKMVSAPPCSESSEFRARPKCQGQISPVLKRAVAPRFQSFPIVVSGLPFGRSRTLKTLPKFVPAVAKCSSFESGPLGLRPRHHPVIARAKSVAEGARSPPPTAHRRNFVNLDNDGFICPFRSFQSWASRCRLLAGAELGTFRKGWCRRAAIVSVCFSRFRPRPPVRRRNSENSENRGATAIFQLSKCRSRPLQPGATL